MKSLIKDENTDNNRKEKTQHVKQTLNETFLTQFFEPLKKN